MSVSRSNDYKNQTGSVSLTINIPSLLEEFSSEFMIKIFISKSDLSNISNPLTLDAAVTDFNSSHYLLIKSGV